MDCPTDVAVSGWVYEGNGYNKYSLSSSGDISLIMFMAYGFSL